VRELSTNRARNLVEHFPAHTGDRAFNEFLDVRESPILCGPIYGGPVPATAIAAAKIQAPLADARGIAELPA